jgi:hypothetical protein
MNDTNTNASDSDATGNDSGNDYPTITRTLVAEADRMDFVDKLFGLSYVLQLEPIAFRFAEQLAENYDYGYWEFFSLSKGGFYMAPRSDTIYEVSADNGFEGQMTGDALGIVACLYTYSNLSFGDGLTSTGDSNASIGEGGFAQTCAEHYHLLREFMFGHVEVRSILRAID